MYSVEVEDEGELTEWLARHHEKLFEQELYAAQAHCEAVDRRVALAGRHRNHTFGGAP